MFVKGLKIECKNIFYVKIVDTLYKMFNVCLKLTKFKYITF